MVISASSREGHIHTRTSQACERCRSLKARCLPSSQDRTCQRCLKSKKECRWADSQAKAKKHRGSSRIAQVERKIDGLVAHLMDEDTSGRNEGLFSTHSGSSRPANFQECGHVNHVLSASARDMHGKQSGNETDQPPDPLEDLANIHSFDSGQDSTYRDEDTTSEDLLADGHLVDGIVAEAEVEYLLAEYRSMEPSFPFVPIDSGTTVQELCTRKPILLLAIITVASWKDRRLQFSLEKRFLREVAHRSIVQPRKDITLLQSVLVYLAWYHYFLDHKLQNLWTLLQLCLGLASDLKLDPTAQSTMFSRCCGSFFTKQHERERQRTLLGCYYMCSMITNATQRPELFKYSTYFSDCCQQLESDCEFESDGVLSLLIRSCYLNYLADDYARIPRDLQSYDVFYLKKLEPFESNVRQLKEEIESKGNPRLSTLLYYVLETKLHRTALHHILEDKSEAQLDSTAGDSIKLERLTLLLESSRSFLDSLMTISTSDFCLVSFAEWTALPYIVTTAAMVSATSQSHPSQWDVRAARDRVRLDLYLESLCHRMQILTTFNPPTQPHPDWWMTLKTVMQSVEGWYKKKLKSGASTSASATLNRSRLASAAYIRPSMSDQNTLHSGPAEGSVGQFQSRSMLTNTPRQEEDTSLSHPGSPEQSRSPFSISSSILHMNMGEGMELDIPHFADMDFGGFGLNFTQFDGF